jgi:hypothetical protein
LALSRSVSIDVSRKQKRRRGKSGIDAAHKRPFTDLSTFDGTVISREFTSN